MGLDEAHLRQDLQVLSHFRAHLEGQLQGRAGSAREKCGRISEAPMANSFVFSMQDCFLSLRQSAKWNICFSTRAHRLKDNNIETTLKTIDTLIHPRSHYMVSDMYLAKKERRD